MTYQLWSFVRNGIVEKAWKEELPAVLSPPPRIPVSTEASKPLVLPPRRQGFWGMALALGEKAATWSEIGRGGRCPIPPMVRVWLPAFLTLFLSYRTSGKTSIAQRRLLLPLNQISSPPPLKQQLSNRAESIEGETRAPPRATGLPVAVPTTEAAASSMLPPPPPVPRRSEGRSRAKSPSPHSPEPGPTTQYSVRSGGEKGGSSAGETTQPPEVEKMPESNVNCPPSDAAPATETESSSGHLLKENDMEGAMPVLKAPIVKVAGPDGEEKNDETYGVQTNGHITSNGSEEDSSDASTEVAKPRLRLPSVRLARM
ncbi:hypothetical protein M378DRAFT_17603 [Amanita muscaria Koide BX008]|uniref:Uncharacterized protein n=1 Tax=Amanita muscaria (strain Koide BX008) TaxID=946122 RepID=A0A0C2WGQ0_AMAMK|nr:hypothetical protein M378DRAFT_17603 [Amanita muscaria Koide BX008]